MTKIGFQDQLSQCRSKVLQNVLSAILSTFIKLPFVIKIFILSIFDRFTQVLLFTCRSLNGVSLSVDPWLGPNILGPPGDAQHRTCGALQFYLLISQKVLKLLCFFSHQGH